MTDFVTMPRRPLKAVDDDPPFRDSLVHPSPFEAPQRFGGHDKLCAVYRVDVDTLFPAASLAVSRCSRARASPSGTSARCSRAALTLPRGARTTPP